MELLSALLCFQDPLQKEKATITRERDLKRNMGLIQIRLYMYCTILERKIERIVLFDFLVYLHPPTHPTIVVDGVSLEGYVSYQFGHLA